MGVPVPSIKGREFPSFLYAQVSKGLWGNNSPVSAASDSAASLFLDLATTFILLNSLIHSDSSLLDLGHDIVRTSEAGPAFSAFSISSLIADDFLLGLGFRVQGLGFRV
jgi:hypothetical protein